MAYSDARKELDCSICLNIYTDPVTLKCGHSFCRDCIQRVLNSQDGSGGHLCPECREEFPERPELHRNVTLHNVVENIRSTEPEQKKNTTFCTYCIHTSVPAVKFCLHCEASLCDNHVKVHSKSPQHVLSDLSPTLESRKCSIHEKILEYYCTQDSALLCGSCRLHGEHQDHRVETLEEASEKKKENLTSGLQALLKKREEMEKSIESLQKHKRKVQDSASGVTKRVGNLFRDIRRQLDTLERKVLNEISRQADNESFPASELIQELEMKKDQLAKKMRLIEELCNMKEALNVLQEPDMDDLCDTEDGDDEDRRRRDQLLLDGGCLDEVEISRTLYSGLSDIVTSVCGGICIPEPADLSLDVDTAHNYLHISDDRKTAHRMDRNLNHGSTPQRFQVYSKKCIDLFDETWREVILPQVMSSQSFSSGRHYWEVDVGGSSHCRVGMGYPSIDRTGASSVIGCNEKSWCLEKTNTLLAMHNNQTIRLDGITSGPRIRVCLDYKAGRLSFYGLGVPSRHLHTFRAFFTEPLHAAFYVIGGSIKVGGGSQGM